MTKKGAGLIITNSKKQYLLVKGVYLPKWSWPKGGLENNETYLECAERETYEECGLIPAHYIIDNIEKPIKAPGRNYFYWEASIINDKQRLHVDLNESSAAGWFTYDEIMLLDTNKDVKWYFSTK
jgi:ADP-ribose pyrophosphatase YjhB (NUDIX family)